MIFGAGVVVLSVLGITETKKQQQQQLQLQQRKKREPKASLWNLLALFAQTLILFLFFSFKRTNIGQRNEA